MGSYFKRFLYGEDGSESIAVLCILACSVIVIAAIATLSGKLDVMSQKAKTDAVVSDHTIGYGNVDIE